MTEPTWAGRNTLLDKFDLKNCSVVDFGCGDKSVLNYQTFKEYIGLDKNLLADIHIDFDTEKVVLDKTYDVGLILGVLEYLEDPTNFVKSVKPYAKKFIIIVLANRKLKIHHGWKTAFTTESFDIFLKETFDDYNIFTSNNYIIAECLK
jgi:hypothetical protein